MNIIENFLWDGVVKLAKKRKKLEGRMDESYAKVAELLSLGENLDIQKHLWAEENRYWKLEKSARKLKEEQLRLEEVLTRLDEKKALFSLLGLEAEARV